MSTYVPPSKRAADNGWCQRQPTGQQLTEQQLANTVLVDGYRYATLDFAAPDGSSTGAQSDFLFLPQGWQIAPNEHRVREKVVNMFTWSAQAVVLADGSTALTKCAGGMFVASPLSLPPCRLIIGPGGERHYKPASDAQGGVFSPPWRILIREKVVTITSVSEISEKYRQQLPISLWESKQFTDCVVVCDGEETPCHRAVLAAASPVFQTMLSSDMREGLQQRIVIEDHDPSVVKAMLGFAYQGRVAEGYERVHDLLRIADKYGMDQLVEVCAFLVSESVDCTNVVDTVRALRSAMGNEKVKDTWDALLERLQKDKELLQVALQSV